MLYLHVCYYVQMNFQNMPQDCLVLACTSCTSTEHYWSSPPSLLCLINARDFTVAEGCTLDTSMLAM